MSAEQHRHDAINLARLLRRLEKTISPLEWPQYENDENDEGRAALRVLGELQKARYARKLLKSLQSEDDDRFHDLGSRLDPVLRFLEEKNERLSYKPKRPEPILPTLPVPESVISLVPDGVDEVEGTEQTLDVRDQAVDLLLSPSDDVSLPPILPLPLPLPDDTLIPNLPTKSTETSTKNTLATNALHEELQTQLSQMSTQLRMNALHFQTSLAADKLALDAVGEKLERNHDSMQSQRTRLAVRDKSARGWRMTGIWLGSVVVVLVAFFIMAWIIRFT
jgi:hypothetical protein